MNIWILNHYASPPDQPATGAFFLAQALAERKHRVTFFSSSFSYYKLADIRIKSPGKLWLKEKYNDVNFVWIKTTPYRKNNWSRAFNMVSYALVAFFAGLTSPEKPDFIIGTCPHPLAVFSAYLLSLIKRSKFVFEVRDLWPQTLIDEGVLSKNSFAAKALLKLEQYLFKKAFRIVTVLPALEAYFANQNELKNKIVSIPNGINLSEIQINNSYDGHMNSSIKVMYVGGHSNYQGLGTILDSAGLLQEDKRNIKFIFVGEGSEKEKLINQAKDRKLNNVEFKAAVPRKDIYGAMLEADIMIYHIKDIPVLKYGISSNKLLDYLVSGKPIIFAANITGNQALACGVCVNIPPENAPALVEAINKIISLTPEERVRMGKNGMEIIRKYYDIKVLADNFEKNILNA